MDHRVSWLTHVYLCCIIHANYRICIYLVPTSYCSEPHWKACEFLLQITFDCISLQRFNKLSSFSTMTLTFDDLSFQSNKLFEMQSAGKIDRWTKIQQNREATKKCTSPGGHAWGHLQLSLIDVAGSYRLQFISEQPFSVKLCGVLPLNFHHC